MNKRYCLWAAWCAVTAIRAADGVEALDLKPGLWEITLTVRTSGVPPVPPDVLAKMTPEEKAKLEAKAKGKAAQGPATTVKRSCLKETELRQPLALDLGGMGQGCRQTVITASRFKLEFRVDCDGEGRRGGGTVRIDAVDREDAHVISSWFGTDGAHTVALNSAATLRWLGAACETVPGAQPEAVPPKAAAPHPPQPPETEAAPADAEHYYKLGKEQLDRNDLWGALRSLDRAIELDPRRATSYNARGYAYLRLQKFANALVEFSTAIRLRSDYANAYRNRAVARQHLGDREGAAADNRKAADLEHPH